MGNITGSCFHEVEWDTPPSWLAAWTKEGEKALNYATYCDACVERARQSGDYIGPGSQVDGQPYMTIDEAWRIRLRMSVRPD